MREYFEYVLLNKQKDQDISPQKKGEELYSQHLWCQLIKQTEAETEKKNEMNWEHIDDMSLESILQNLDEETDELLPDSYSEKNKVLTNENLKSFLWGDQKDQQVWEILTVHDTNLDRGDRYKVFPLLLSRAFCLATMIWLIKKEFEFKGYLHLQYYTVWGEIGTCAVFGLLFLCSLEKFVRQVGYNFNIRQLQEGGRGGEAGQILFKVTAWLFQWTMICELTVTLCFWLYLEIFLTDIRGMSNDQIESKLIFDLLIDVENYNHSLPLLLLCFEFMINNIPFTWNHFKTIFLANQVYLFSHIVFSLYYKVSVYDSLDWNQNPLLCAQKSALIWILIPYGFYILMNKLTELKFWMNGIDYKIKAVKG